MLRHGELCQTRPPKGDCDELTFCPRLLCRAPVSNERLLPDHQLLQGGFYAAKQPTPERALHKREEEFVLPLANPSAPLAPPDAVTSHQVGRIVQPPAQSQRLESAKLLLDAARWGRPKAPYRAVMGIQSESAELKQYIQVPTCIQ